MKLKECVLCNQKEDDAIKYGELMHFGKRIVHYYCLLLSSNLIQSGKDDEGLLGFLEPDIMKEAERALSYKCKYCKMFNANIGCCAKKCQVSFHLSCGIREGCSNAYIGTYQSYCAQHSKFEKKKPPPENEICVICREILGKYKKHLIFRAPCCKSGWFHRWCLAEMALNSGYFFKCPLCNNSDNFRHYFQKKSIYVPDQDAAWEREPNAFADLLERPDTCSAEECRCPNGRKSNAKGQELIPCSMCGSKARHKRCTTTGRPYATFICNECDIFTENSSNSDQSRKMEGTQIAIHKKNTDDNSDVDIDIESLTSESNTTQRNTPILREVSNSSDIVLIFSESDNSSNSSDNRMNYNKPGNTKHNVPEISSYDCSKPKDQIDELFSIIKKRKRSEIESDVESKIFSDVKKVQIIEKRIHSIEEVSIFGCSTSFPVWSKEQNSFVQLSSSAESNNFSKGTSNSSINVEDNFDNFFSSSEKKRSTERRVTRSMSLGCPEFLYSIESDKGKRKQIRPSSCLHFS